MLITALGSWEKTPPAAIRIYIVSDEVQKGAVWPLQPVYDIMRSERLQKGEGVYRVWIYIVGDVVQEGAVWPLQPVYDLIGTPLLLRYKRATCEMGTSACRCVRGDLRGSCW